MLYSEIEGKICIMVNKIFELIQKSENYEDVKKQFDKNISSKGFLTEQEQSIFLILTIEQVLASKSSETYNHSQKMMSIIKDIAAELKLTPEQTKEFVLIARFHDIGKIMISPSILNHPGKLNEEQWKEVKKHAQHSASLLNEISSLSHLANDAMHHHERFDGSGYPSGLKGEEIPLKSRALALVDTYEVLTSGRCYKSAISSEAALEEIKKNAGSQFDPNLVEMFVKVIDKTFQSNHEKENGKNNKETLL